MLSLLLAGLIVGVTDICPTNGNAQAEGDYFWALEKAGHAPVLIANGNNAEQIRRIVAALDVVLFTGGGDDINGAPYDIPTESGEGCPNAERNRLEDLVLAECLRTRKPIIGICRGMQFLNVRFGGSLYQDIPTSKAFKPKDGIRIEHRPGEWADNVTNPPAHTVEIVPGSRLAKVIGTEPLAVVSHHHQAPYKVAPGFKVSAIAPDGVVECIESTDYPIVGFQFHPERAVGSTKHPGYDIPRTLKIFQNLLQLLQNDLAEVPETDGANRIDFSTEGKPIRPALHGSGFGPGLSAGKSLTDAEFAALGLAAARTHDWALVNRGQRCCDTHFIFPLMHLDADDPGNYFFKPTDELLARTRAAGLKVLFRLGTSIEHTGDVFYNAAVPEDFDKYAEVLAHIVRHYTRGWANGYNWDIGYWEIWNEPEHLNNMWRISGEEGKDREKMRDRFIRFYVTVLKRLKTEFPDLKIGGPALGGYRGFLGDYIERLLTACAAANVRPDFFSWHSYETEPANILREPAIVRELCDRCGFPKMELILDEWHYLPYATAWADYKGSPVQRRRVLSGPAGQHGIDSAVFTLATLCGFQSTPLDQAYFYGCDFPDWGCRTPDGDLNKPYYALKAFGDVVRGGGTFVTGKGDGNLTLFGATAADGTKRLVVCDFRGEAQEISIDVSGVDPETAPTVRQLDDVRNLAPARFEWRRGRLTLFKDNDLSSAWTVEF